MESTTILPRPSAPATPEHAPSTISHPGVRRVHTLPAKLAPPQLDTVETLFVHSEAKVVSFNVAAVVGTRPGSSAGRRRTLEGDASGTLAWSSPSERTLAAGMSKVLGLYMHLLTICRTTANLQSSQFGCLVPQFGPPTPSYSTKVTMLVCGRTVLVCAARARGDLLSYRTTVCDGSE